MYLWIVSKRYVLLLVARQMKIPLIAPEDIEPDSLVQFLNKALEDYPDLLAVGKGHQSRSQFKKCISIWDWLKYSNAAKIR